MSRTVEEVLTKPDVIYSYTYNLGYGGGFGAPFLLPTYNPRCSFSCSSSDFHAVVEEYGLSNGLVG